MAKLVALSALLGAAVALEGRPVRACEKDHCSTHGSSWRVDVSDDDDDDRDRDDDDDDDDDSDRDSGPGYHIRISGPIRGTHVVAPEPPEPPRWRTRTPRAEVAFPEAPQPRIVEISERSEGPANPSSSIGVGLRASTLHVGRNGANAASGGVLLRFRAHPVEIELDIGRDEYFGDIARSDTRIGASLYVPLTSGHVVPFLVAGTGMNFSFFNATGDELHQGYLSGGGGLAFNVSRRFALELDGRFMLRQFFDDTAVVARQGITGDEPARDQTVEVRLAGIFYF